MARPKGSKNKPKAAAAAPKATKGKKAPKPAKVAAAEPENVEDGPALTDMELQDLFLADKNALISGKEKLDKAVAAIRNIKKRIKSNGFTVKMVEAAILMETEEGEEKIRTETAQLLQAAKWVGVPWGSQIDMFQEPDRTPAVDKSFDAGKRASMEDKPRKAPHAQESPQARAWYAGYDEHQAELHKGFKKKNGSDNVTSLRQPAEQQPALVG